MNGALDSVSAFPSITFVAAFIGPVLTLILVAILWFFRRRLRLPAVLPGILLALTSIAPQIMIGAFGILRAFQQIASDRRTGVRNVAGSMAGVSSNFPTAIYFTVACIVTLIAFQIFCAQHDNVDDSERPTPGNNLAPRILFFFTAASALASMALLWFFERTLDLVMVVCDNSRKLDAQRLIGDTPIGDVAAVISRRLLVCEFFSFALLAILFTGPFWLIAGEAPEWVRERSLTLAIVILLCLIPFGVAYHQEILYMISLTQPK
jgi:hypothetical protein